MRYLILFLMAIASLLTFSNKSEIVVNDDATNEELIASGGEHSCYEYN